MHPKRHGARAEHDGIAAVLDSLNDAQEDGVAESGPIER